MSATWGNNLKLTIFGESHGPSIGGVLDGLPAGIKLDNEAINRQMARRRPGQSPVSTARHEIDRPEILSGLFNEATTGAPLCFVIKNSDTRYGDYSAVKDLIRPGHADYTARVKFDGFNDYRGGGHFSGRLTAVLVFAGAVAAQLPAMKGISAAAHILSVAGITDSSLSATEADAEVNARLAASEFPTIDESVGKAMQNAILAAKKSMDSLGGIVECAVYGLQAGLGEPFFDSAESMLAHMMFAIPAVKGLEFGTGFGITGLRGSQANDAFVVNGDRISTTTNHNGGINGGITNGMPVIFRAAFKPTPSIAKKQATVDMTAMKQAELELHGRHDPCVVPRAVPVVEAAATLVFADLMMSAAARKGGKS